MYNNPLQEAIQQLNKMDNKPRRTLKEQRTGNFNINSKINDDRMSANYILNDILEEEAEHYKYLIGNSVPGFSTLSNLKVEKIIPTAYSWGVAGVANLDNPKLIYVSMGIGNNGGMFAGFGKDGIEKLLNIFVRFRVGGSGTLIKLNNNPVNIPCDIIGSYNYEIKYSNENGPLVTWKDLEEFLKSEIKNCIDKYEQGELDMNNLAEVDATVDDNDIKTIKPSSISESKNKINESKKINEDAYYASLELKDKIRELKNILNSKESSLTDEQKKELLDKIDELYDILDLYYSNEITEGVKESESKSSKVIKESEDSDFSLYTSDFSRLFKRINFGEVLPFENIGTIVSPEDRENYCKKAVDKINKFYHFNFVLDKFEHKNRNKENISKAVYVDSNNSKYWLTIGFDDYDNHVDFNCGIEGYEDYLKNIAETTLGL